MLDGMRDRGGRSRRAGQNVVAVVSAGEWARRDRASVLPYTSRPLGDAIGFSRPLMDWRSKATGLLTATATLRTHRNRPASRPAAKAKTSASRTRNDHKISAVRGRTTSSRLTDRSRADDLAGPPRAVGSSRRDGDSTASAGRPTCSADGLAMTALGIAIAAATSTASASSRLEGFAARGDGRERAAGSKRSDTGSSWTAGNAWAASVEPSADGGASQSTTTGSIRLADDDLGVSVGLGVGVGLGAGDDAAGSAGSGTTSSAEH